MSPTWTIAPAAPREARRPRPWPALLRQVAADHIDQAVFVVVFVAVGFGDSILLPFDFTQRISFANWGYLDARYVAFSVAFALAMAWVLTLQIHAVRRVIANASNARAARSGGPLGTLAAVVSLLPSFLCCGPIVPTLVGLFGLSASTQLRTTGSIEYFFATKQNWLLLGSLALVVASGVWSMRKLARAACLDELGCAVADGPPRAARHDEALRSGEPHDDDGALVAAAAAGDEDSLR